MSGDRAEDVRCRARAVGAVLGRAEELVPSGVEGVDAAGAVRMTLGADGLPSAIGFPAGRARVLRPDRVGVAVTQAFADASAGRMAAWAEALGTAGVRPGAAVGAAPPGFEEPTRPRVPPAGRTIDDATEAMIAAVHRSTVAPVGAGGVGSVADGRLVRTVSSSAGVRCDVDADWAGMQSAGSLTAAFGAALAAARAKSQVLRTTRPGRARRSRCAAGRRVRPARSGGRGNGGCLMAPTPDELVVATGALRSEAGVWREQSVALTGIGSAVGGLDFSGV